MGESKDTSGPLTTAASRNAPAIVFVFRIALLVVAASATTAALVVGLRRDPSVTLGGFQYVCPMHPEVTSAIPGECPICRMQLEAVGGDEPGARSTGVNTSTFQVYDYVRRQGFGPRQRVPAWVESDGYVSAILYKDEFTAMTPSEAAVFSPSSAPATSVDVRLSPEPAVPWDASTSRLRFRIDAHSGSPRPGEVGWVKLAGKRLDLQTVPYSAVLQGAEGPYVLVASADGRMLSRRPIEIGRVLGGTAVVLAGLRLRERVLIRGAFFVDAERRLRRESVVELAP